MAATATPKPQTPTTQTVVDALGGRKQGWYTKGARHYRTVSIQDVVEATQRATGFAAWEQVAHWILERGPVFLRFRTKATTTADPSTGRLTMRGEKGARVDAAITGYDERYGFRVLMPYGVGWGQAGRCWVTPVEVQGFIQEPTARLEGVTL